MAVVLSDILLQAVEKARPVWARIDALRLQNQHRVLQAFRRNGISEYHLFGTTGYGYNDPSREALGRVYADALQAETAMVQPQLISAPTRSAPACSASCGRATTFCRSAGSLRDAAAGDQRSGTTLPMCLGHRV